MPIDNSHGRVFPVRFDPQQRLTLQRCPGGHRRRPGADMRRHLGLLVLLFTVGCDNAQLPAQPTAPLPAPTLQEFRLTGSVRDTASRPLSAARVEVIAGPNAGTVTTTNERGRFSMPESFTGVITVRASKDGYAPETTSIPSPRALERLPAGGASNWDMSFDLAPLGPSVDLAGLHTMTLTADRACTNLPEAARAHLHRNDFIRLPINLFQCAAQRCAVSVDLAVCRSTAVLYPQSVRDSGCRQIRRDLHHNRGTVGGSGLSRNRRLGRRLIWSFRTDGAIGGEFRVLSDDAGVHERRVLGMPGSQQCARC